MLRQPTRMLSRPALLLPRRMMGGIKVAEDRGLIKNSRRRISDAQCQWSTNVLGSNVGEHPISSPPLGMVPTPWGRPA